MGTEIKPDFTRPQSEIDDIIANMPQFGGFTPPSSANLEALGKWNDFQFGYRKKFLGEYQDINRNEPYKNQALGYANQTLGGAGANIQDYFSQRGISPPGNINRDTRNEAGRMQTEAQRKINVKAKQLQLGTIEKMLGHVGQPSAGMASMASTGLTSDSQASQVLAQGYANAMQQFQYENPVPGLHQEQSSSWLGDIFGVVAPLALSVAFPAMAPMMYATSAASGLNSVGRRL